ncbi:MAG: hypothetical protein HOY71_06225, partial [Nonomuraea sp.]|nr:hypothetical protein [Nonomuraea sp.]
MINVAVNRVRRQATLALGLAAVGALLAAPSPAHADAASQPKPTVVLV